MKNNPLTELRAYLGAFAERCQSARWSAALFHVSVVQDIAADVSKNTRNIEDRAYSAQQADHEAMTILDEVLEDGRVSPSEISRLRLARRHIGNSERADCEVCELARA